MDVDETVAVLANPAAPREERRMAAYNLGRSQEARAEPALLAALSYENKEIREEAARSLGILHFGKAKRPRTREALIDRLQHDPEASVRGGAAYGLGGLHDKEAAEPLLQVLANGAEAAAVRGEAAEAMANLWDARAIPVLVTVLSDPEPEVRFWAAFALGQIAGGSVIPALARLADDPAVVPHWWSVGKEAADAIACIRERQGQPRARRPRQRR